MSSILFLMPYLTFGGAERLLSLIAARLATDGHEVHIVVLTPRSEAGAAADEWFSSPAVMVHRIAPAGDSDLVERLDEIAATVDAAIAVLVNPTPAYRVLGKIRQRRPDLRLVSFQFNEHELSAEHRRYGAFIDAIIVESERVARTLVNLGVSENRLCIIPGSPDLQLLTPRAPFGESEISARIRGLAKPIVSFVGRLDPIKAPHLFVLICAKLRERPASFVIAGEGPAASDITRLVRSVNLEDRVVQVGRVSYDCVGDVYRSSDVVVVPSLVDGRPLVVQEAQACGAVVVASRVGGIPELIEDGITGSLCEPGNVDDFASKIDLLLSTPAMRVSIGQQGREKVTRSGGLMASLPSYMKAITGSDAMKPASPVGRHASSRKGAP